MASIALAIRDEIKRAVSRQIREAGLAVEIRRLTRQAERLQKAVASLQAMRTPKPTARARAAVPRRKKVDRRSLRFSPSSLKSLRKKIGVTQGELAELLGVSGNAVWQWEAGRAKPRLQSLQAIRELRKLGKRGVQKRIARI